MILNASYEPLTIVSSRRAILLILSGKAIALEVSNKVYNSANQSLEIPYVIKLSYYIHRPADVAPAKYSKSAVLARDRHSCAYCGKRADTIDHVVPKRHGGDNSYENCVAACLRCNSKKADKLLKEIGYELRFKPYAPSRYSNLLSRLNGSPELFAVWSKYVFLYQPHLEEIFKSRPDFVFVEQRA